MDAGPSHSSSQLLSSESQSQSQSDEYSDADSEWDTDAYRVSGEPQDGVFVEARVAAADYSDEYEDERHEEKGKGKRAANGVTHGNGFSRPLRSRIHPAEKKHKDGKAKETRSWSDLDVSMIIALLSPVGNWLTGSDHVKNLFLLMLLIFYLHQLIEVPWQLYKSARSHVSPRLAHKLEQAADTTSAAARLALSELHALEVLYLSCTVIAPFVGAVLIRYVFAAMNGVDSLSWFSTTLFVLATGIRPWSHLVSRLHERTAELRDTVDEPERDEREHQNERTLHDIEIRMEILERVVTELKAKASKIAPLQEACDDISEAIEDMERSVLRHERKVEASRIAQGSRISAMERCFSKLEECQRKQLTPHTSDPDGLNGLYVPVPPGLSQAISRALELPQQLHDKALLYLASNLPHRTLQQQPSKLDTISPTVTPSHTQETLHYFNGTPLETIPEADDSDSDGTYVSDKVTPSASHSPLLDKKKSARVKSRSRSQSHSSIRSSTHKQKSFSRKAFDWAAAFVSWPYRCAMKILIVIVPSPIQKLFV